MKPLLIILEVLCFLIIFYPVIWERNDDKHGETLKEKRGDIPIRFLLMLAVSLVNYLLRDLHFMHLTFTLKGILKPFIMSAAQFFLTFDYVIHSRLGHKGWKAFTYLGKTPNTLDTNKLWIRLGPWGRFILKLIVFGLAMIYYF